jgi:hypothetical protein
MSRPDWQPPELGRACRHWDGARYCAAAPVKLYPVGYRCDQHAPDYPAGYRGGGFR